MAERDIRKALKERVEAYGGEVRAMAWLGRRNAPDVMCLFTSETYRKNPQTGGVEIVPPHPFVETKAPGGKPTAAQTREHNRMREAGCTVFVISTLAQLDAWLPPAPVDA